MANPFYLAARMIDLGWDAFKIGKSAKLGEKVANFGRKVGNARFVADTAGNVADTTMGVGRAAAVGGSVRAAKFAGKAHAWWDTTGKSVAKGAAVFAGRTGEALVRTPQGQRMATAGISAGVGYYTSDPNASAGDKFGRALGFGIAGHYGATRFQDAKFGKNVSNMFKRLGGIDKGNWGTRIKQAGGFAGRAVGMPAKWGYKQSMMAGAMYGMMSDQTSILEGVAAGATLHFGAKKMGSAWNPERQAQVKGLYNSKGLGAAFKAAPVFRSAVWGGMMIGAYNSTGENGMGMNVLGGAAKGALTGMALGGGTKAMMKAPTTSLALGLGGLTFAGSALEGLNTFAQAGAPGFDTLNADGDLALSLHRMRHG